MKKQAVLGSYLLIPLRISVQAEVDVSLQIDASRLCGDQIVPAIVCRASIAVFLILYERT